MINSSKKQIFISALTDMLPGSSVVSVENTDWQSATFAGVRSRIILSLTGTNAPERAEAFAAQLPDTEFSTFRYLVADISVAKICEQDGMVTLVIEALLIRE
jgi:hypothetical protein